VTAIPRRLVAWLDSRQAARVVWLVALLALCVSVWFGSQQYQLTRCQARYAEVSNTSQRARAEAAEKDRRAQDQLFQSIADEPGSAISSLRSYNESRMAADKQRAANPIPPPPSTNCG
jgi:hypothetical protein